MRGDVYDQIGERIRELRSESGLTQAELAEKVGITVESLSRAERGVILPTVRTLGHLAGALGVSLTTLAQGEPRHAAHDKSADYESPELKRLKRLLDDLEPRSVAKLIGIAQLLPKRRIDSAR